MTTAIFKRQDKDGKVYQAIANTDAEGKVYVNYICALEVGMNAHDIPKPMINMLVMSVTEWAEKKGFQMWAY